MGERQATPESWLGLLGPPVLGIVMYFLALAPAIPLLHPALAPISIETSRGRWLYIAFVTVAGALWCLVLYKQAKAQKQQFGNIETSMAAMQKDVASLVARDSAKARESYTEQNEPVPPRLETAFARIDTLVEPGAGELKIEGFAPEVIISGDSGESGTAATRPPPPSIVPLSGTIRATQALLKAANVLAEIRENPPQTDEEIRKAAERLENSVARVSFKTSSTFTADGSVTRGSEGPPLT